MSKFRYKAPSSDAIRNRATQKGGDYDSIYADGATVLKVKEGELNLRVLPPTWDFKKWGDNWALEIWLHRSIGADKGTYLCAKKMGQGECPICDARSEIDDEEVQKSLKPGKRMVAYVIDRDNEKLGPQIWSFGWKQEKEIQARSEDKKSGEILEITNPDEGYDISFIREGTKKENTQYLRNDVARDPTPLSEKQTRQDAWLEYITEHPLPTQLVFHGADYIEEIFSAKKSSKRDEDEEEDEKPTRSRRSSKDEEDEEEDRKPARRRASKDEDEDEEDERPSRRASKRDEEDEEDERPSRRRAAKDEDDEDEKPRRSRASKDEDDEDEAPKKGKRIEIPDEDEVNEMEETELAEVVEKFDLDVDLEKITSTRKMRRAVIDALADVVPSKGSRRAQKDEDEEEDEDDKTRGRASKRSRDEDEEDEKKPADRARKSLERLKPKTRG